MLRFYNCAWLCGIYLTYTGINLASVYLLLLIPHFKTTNLDPVELSMEHLC